MAKNTGNLNDGSDTLALARKDLYDMATDMGYRATGNVSPISTTGGNNKIVKTDSSGNAVLTGGLTAGDATLVDVSDANAFNVKNGSGDSVFSVDTVKENVTYSANKIPSNMVAGNTTVPTSSSFTELFDLSTLTRSGIYYITAGVGSQLTTQPLKLKAHMLISVNNDDGGYTTINTSGTGAKSLRLNVDKIEYRQNTGVAQYVGWIVKEIL